MKRIYFILAGISLILFMSCARSEKGTKDTQTVKIDTVVSASSQTALQFPGKVKAAQDISLAFRVSGTIRKIYVEDGARVREGQLLAELDPADYRVQLDATEAEYKQIKAEAERVMALYKENGTTPNANDKAVYGLKQITAKYQHHKDQLEYTRLYAPFCGFIQKKLFEAHETIGAGMPVISMVSAGIPEVEINLPAADYIRRDRFDGYHCTFDLYPGENYPLKLISGSPKANANQLYTMRLQMVPGWALLQKDGITYVFGYDPSAWKVHCCEVTVLRLLSDGRAMVVSDTLHAGEIVVASGVHHIEDGENVRPLATGSKTNVGVLL